MCDVGTDFAEFYNEKRRRARVAHECCACAEPIKPGNHYVRIAGKWDGDFGAYKQCLRCHRMMLELWDRVTQGDAVDIELDCGADALEPEESDRIGISWLAFATPEEMESAHV